MILEKIEIENFRNYEKLDLNFKKGINVIFGNNGEGKTSLVEAINYLSNLSSFRTNDDRNLIRNKSEVARIRGLYGDKDLYIEITRQGKKIEVDRIEYKKYRDYIGIIDTITFTPQEVYLLQDSPKERRKFVDKEISKINKKYIRDLILFNKYIKERNDVLKSKDKYKMNYLDVIDEKIIPIQKRIIVQRKSFLKELESKIKEKSKDFDYKYNLKINYDTFVKVDDSKIEEEITKVYLENRNKDIENGSTYNGINKDDWQIFDESGLQVSNYASQGEQRVLIIMLKLSMIEILQEFKKIKPILILDDVLFELDEIKKRLLLALLKSVDQVFITCCDISDVDFIKEQTHQNKNFYEVVDEKIFLKEDENNVK